MLIKHPRTGLPDVMLTMTVVTVVTAAAKFLLDGATANILGHVINFGHVDPSAYGMFLAPVLGAHGYTMTRPNTMSPLAKEKEDE